MGEGTNWRPTADELTLEGLSRRYREALVRYCGRQLGDADEAEDAAHDAILRAFVSRESFQDGSEVWPWLAAIASHRCADIKRRRAKLEPLEAQPDEAIEDVETAAISRFRQRVVSQALAATRRRYRLHVYLRDVEGWSYGEIAAFDGSTVNLVRHRLFRARQALRDEAKTRADRERLWPMPVALTLSWARLRRAYRRRLTDARATLADASSRFSLPAASEVLAAQPLTSHLAVAALLSLGPLMPSAFATSEADAPSMDVMAAELSASHSSPVQQPPADPSLSTSARPNVDDNTTAAAPVLHTGPAPTVPSASPPLELETPPTASTSDGQDLLVPDARPEVARPSPAIGVAAAAAPSTSTRDDGGTQYVVDPAGDITVDPGLDDPGGERDVEPPDVGVTPCPEPEYRQEVKALVCGAIEDPGSVTTPTTMPAETDPATTSTTALVPTI